MTFPRTPMPLDGPATWMRSCTWTPAGRIDQPFEPPLQLAADELILYSEGGLLGVYAAPDDAGQRPLRAKWRLGSDQVWRPVPEGATT